MSVGSPLPPVEVRILGVVPYRDGLELQEHLVARRRSEEIPDQLLLLEHPPVVTLGTSAHREHLLLSPEELEKQGIGLFEAGRGGDVTYHGPGQLVGYPILRLPSHRRDLHGYLRDLEEVLIRALRELGVEGYREPGYTGVWTKQGKVAAIGVRVSSGWITSHGFALNVGPTPDGFRAIVPCGIANRPVTSVEEVLHQTVGMEEVIPLVVKHFGEVFELEPIVV